MHFKRPQDARDAGIETVYQTLAVAPALDIASNLFLGRERRRPGPLGTVLRMLDKKGMRRDAGKALADLGIGTLQNMAQPVETLSGGQRQAVAVARAAAFGSKVIVLDEPTAALGVKESNQVLKMIEEVRSRGLPVILISHNMPHVFEVADRIHIQRLGRCAGVVTPTLAHDVGGGGDHDRCDHPRRDPGPACQRSRVRAATTRPAPDWNGTVITVVGEALVDLIEDAPGDPVAHPGGSPANVAVALARLGRSVNLLTQLGDDAHGQLLLAHLRDNGVRPGTRLAAGLRRAPARPAPTSARTARPTTRSTSRGSASRDRRCRLAGPDGDLPAHRITRHRAATGRRRRRCARARRPADRHGQLRPELPALAHRRPAIGPAPGRGAGRRQRHRQGESRGPRLAVSAAPVPGRRPRVA